MLWEVVRTGLVELWAHKLRSVLTLTLLMLGVFALVVMTSVLDGVMDKVTTGFAGMSWDGTVRIAPKAPETAEERDRFAMSPGLRDEDLGRLTAPNPKVLAFLPRAQKEVSVRVTGGTERTWVIGVTAPYGALLGTVSGALLCQALSASFPYGLVVNPLGLLLAWIVALALALVFGLYPALRASRLSPMEAMR
jgi:putative ABC transport system permease protein